MGEKAPHMPLLQDNLIHPTAPPSYDEAMVAGKRENQSITYPSIPHQGYASHVAPNPPVPQPNPQVVAMYPNQPGGAPYPAATPPVQLPMYSTQPVHNQPPPVSVVNVSMPAPRVVAFGPKRMRIRCHHCGADIRTSTVSSNKMSAHIACLVLCFFTCCLCWIPYCMSTCKKIDHSCPNCKNYLGAYNA